MIFNQPLEEYDFVIRSDDHQSYILFSLIDVELERMKSINYLVHIKDDQFAGRMDTCFEENMLNHFLEGLLENEHSEMESIQLKSMSPEELEVTFINQKMGYYEVAYSMKKIKYLRNRSVETTLTGTFQYDAEFLIQLKERLKKVTKMLEK